MRLQGWILLAGLAALVAAGPLAYGCARKDTPTSPGPGPGPGPGPVANTPFDSGLRPSGFVYTRSFPAAGAVPYYCIPHGNGGMTGSVTVSASSNTDLADVVVAPGGAFSFSPASVTVKVGGQVRWTWASSNHTVTSGTPTGPGGRSSHMSDTGVDAGH